MAEKTFVVKKLARFVKTIRVSSKLVRGSPSPNVTKTVAFITKISIRISTRFGLANIAASRRTKKLSQRKCPTVT